MNNYKMAYGGFIQKSEMDKREQESYGKAVMKGISITGSYDGITFSTYNEYLAQNLAKSFADIGYDTKVVGGAEKYGVWVRKTYSEGGEMRRGGDRFDEGGEIDIEDLPTEVQEVLEKYQYEEEDYHTMLRMSRELKDLGYTFDFGLDAIPTNFRKMKKGGQVGEIKDAIDILESLGDDIDDNVKQALDMLKIVYDEMELPEQPKSIEDIIGENAYKKGGRMKFRDKVDAIADRLEGTKVPKRLRKDYGVTFNREEAEMSGRRIVGSMVKKYGK